MQKRPSLDDGWCREKARTKYACHDICYMTTTSMWCVLEQKAKIDPAGPWA